eukprot:8960844-Pyramimonas_sp.AAC.1
MTERCPEMVRPTGGGNGASQEPPGGLGNQPDQEHRFKKISRPLGSAIHSMCPGMAQAPADKQMLSRSFRDFSNVLSSSRLFTNPPMSPRVNPKALITATRRRSKA